MYEQKRNRSTSGLFMCTLDTPFSLLVFFVKHLYFFFSNVCYSVFFQSEGKIRYRTRRIIAIVFFLNLPVGISVHYALSFFFCLSCRHYRSFVKECTDLLSSCTYTYATHTKVHAISVLLFCKLYLLIILKLREPMHFFLEQQNNVSFSLLIANSTY